MAMVSSGPTSLRYEASEVVEQRLRHRDVPSEVSVLVVPRQVGHQGKRITDDARVLVIEPAPPQKPHGSQQFTAEQKPVGRDGSLQLLRALGSEGGVLLGTPRQH